ncbi:hypothetical protein FAZ15_03930 [Sphingobacterium olei]|uniref:Carboxypeptidase-like regulatory domain-containing protein n=1 Tax=Sphingobacterium olei TaxID=2571155 RepID=A0A4U0P7V1_9SPHI|nr:hypothetical protein [Sphingobacterium olei]TJZ63440.1 hypothetical protein FAZ15_03930 [Sphingobacterium olei]
MNKINYVVALIVFLLAGIATPIQAQDYTGIVYELESSHTLWNVTVTNLRTKEQVNTDREGRFKISAKLYDYLELELPGYQKDTAFLYEEGVRRIYLLRDDNTILINEVLVTRLTDSRLIAEIARAKNEGKVVDASQQQGGLRVSPSRLFGRKAKEARKNLDLLITEQNNRQIDRKFTNQLIASLVPLSEDEIPLFKERYRPKLEFVQIASPQDLQVYILDSYKKFRAED